MSDKPFICLKNGSEVIRKVDVGFLAHQEDKSCKFLLIGCSFKEAGKLSPELVESQQSLKSNSSSLQRTKAAQER